MSAAVTTSRRVVYRTRGHVHGPVTRLMSPSDLGELLKPFVFLDIFSLADSSKSPFDLHPHSGIATVTVFTEGDASFDDGQGNSGNIGYGGVEWMCAGRGVWHGKELGAGHSKALQGFQLWLALPADLELADAESQYLEAASIPEVGPARLIIGRYDGQQSPVRAQAGVNYLIVTLKPGESWRYETPAGQTAGWLAVSSGEVMLDAPASVGEMIIFDDSDRAIEMRSTGEVDAKLVIGSAAPHPHSLHLGNYSVHTSAEALKAGERHIMDLHKELIERERQPPPHSSGPVPVLR
ncbi:pirin family protein [Mesorhizobium sp. M0028]|uniref:pirin family protein n=1 Tax=Mesorhizobium sp. M0028 TaxID=2956849 RepID=UPI00333AEB22